MVNTMPIPADFPLQWDNPADAQLSWRLDSHVTTAAAPLSSSAIQAILRGFRLAFADLGLPLQMRFANFNGYSYAAMMPPPAPPIVRQTMGLVNRIAPALGQRVLARKMADLDQQQQAILQPILARFAAYWQDDLLPQNRKHLAFFERADLATLSLPQLRAQLAEGLQHAAAMGKLHALAAFPALAAMSLFEECYCELLPTATPLDALRLLQGFDNQTIRGDRALWQLSRSALAKPTVADILTTHTPDCVLAALAQSSEAKAFLAELDGYLQPYGRRLNQFGQLTEASWLEAPQTAIACLQTYLTQPNGNPEQVQARLIAERERAVAEARQRLANQPAATIERFETLLTAAQSAVGVKEDNHWIMQELLYQLRRLALALGQKSQQAGELSAVEDVFYLSADELVAGTATSAGSVQAVSLAELQKRQATRVRFMQVKPPPLLGTSPAANFTPNSAFFRAMRKAEVIAPQPSPLPT
jgi:pyruvate,water dikinase